MSFKRPATPVRCSLEALLQMGGRTSSGPDERAGSTTGMPGGSRHPLRLSGTGGSGPGCQSLVQHSVTSQNPIPSGPARARFGTRSLRAAPDASPFGSCGSDPADGSRPRVLPAHVRSRWRAGRGRALGRRLRAATAAHTADRAERRRAGQHLDGLTGSPAGRSLPHDHGRASAHTRPPTQTPQQAPVGAAPGPAARRPGRAGHCRGWPAVPQGRRRP
jgi:hypothetical protein